MAVCAVGGPTGALPITTPSFLPLPALEGPDQAPWLPVSQLRESWGITWVTAAPAEQGQKPHLTPEASDVWSSWEGGIGDALAFYTPVSPGIIRAVWAHEGLLGCSGWSVPVWGLTQAPDLGRPTADCIPALPPASWVALGKSLYLSMPVSSNETVSSLSPPSRVCGHCMGCVECSAHRAEND